MNNRDRLTAQLNSDSIDGVREQIFQKNNTRPYFANSRTVMSSITDMDHHPYTRWFRGVYYFPEPIIMEREAGWRPDRSYCYDLTMPPPSDRQPHICFEPACSTQLPCFPGKTNEQLDSAINDNCLVQYR